MDYPIIMSAPMILRLLAEANEVGTGKSMTRRLAWGRWLTVQQAAKHKAPLRVRGEDEKAPAYAQAASSWQRVEVGDRLYVRENFWRFGRWIGIKKTGNPSYSFAPCSRPGGNLIFVADYDNGHPLPMGQFGSYDPAWHLRPNIFLPREESRLTLIVREKEIERLHDISEVHCEMEGLEWTRNGTLWRCVGPDGGDWHVVEGARECFAWLWRKLHGAESWDQNPEVVVLGFHVILGNIDSTAANAAA